MTVEAEVPQGVSFTHREVLGILSGILLGLLLAALDQTIVTPALPTLAGEFRGLEHLSWVVSAYLLTSTASTPIYGKLSDLYGRRLLLQVAIVGFVAASVLCALAQNMSQLIAARALQGLGGGGLISMAQAVIADVIAPRERGRYQAYFSGVWAVASVGGPVLGGFFVDHLSWRWIFWLNLPIGIAGFLLCRRALRRLKVEPTRRQIDYAGALLLTAAVMALLLLSSWGGTEFAWLSPTILGLLAAGIVLLGAFVLRELSAPDPILPPRIFANSIIRFANITSFIVSMATFGALVLLPVFLQLVRGVGAGHSGVLLTPFMGGVVAGAFIAGQLMRRTGRYKPFPLIGLALSTAAFLLLAGMDEKTAAGLIIVYMGVLGIGIGTTMPVMLVVVQNAAQARDIGVATSTVPFFRSLGGSFGAAILWSVLLTILTHRLAALGEGEASLVLLRGGPEATAGLPEAARGLLVPALVQSFRLVFLIGAGITGLGLLTTALIKEVPLRTAPAASSASRKPVD